MCRIALVRDFLKMLSCRINVYCGCRRINFAVPNDDHDERVLRKEFNERAKRRISNRQAAEICIRRFSARQLELLDDVGDFFETMLIIEICPRRMGNHQKSCLFEEDDLVSVAHSAEMCHLLVEKLNVRNKRVDNGTPSCEQSFIPDRSWEASHVTILGAIQNQILVPIF